MLYERWRQIASEHRQERALLETITGREWTFGELMSAEEKSESCPGSLCFPQGRDAEFILELLAAWRRNRVVCPLESDQSRPDIPVPPPPCVHLKTTSATTGKPRLAAFTAEQLVADVDGIVETMGLRPDWPNLGAISLAHSYGFSNLVLPLLLHGIPLILLPSPLPETVRQAARRESALTLAAVPTLWRTWHDAGVIAGNVQLAISAGAPLPLELERQTFKACGLKIHNFYGATECGGIAYDRSQVPRELENCVGSAMAHVRLSLTAQGHLRVQSPAVGECYWPEPPSALHNGCFASGDLAELAGDLVYLRGRAADQINVAGRKIAPEPIEHALRQHPAVRDCLVFGVPGLDVNRAETIAAAVVPRKALEGHLLRQFLLERLPAEQVPREWLLVPSLNANRRGKTSRSEWQQRFLKARVNPQNDGDQELLS